MDKSLKIKWDNVLLQLSEQFTPVTFETIFKYLEPLEISDDVFTVYAPPGFVKETVEHRYHKQIEENLHTVVDSSVKLRFIDDKNFDLYSAKKKIIDDALLISQLNSKYKFSNFVKGKSNELAYPASMAVAEKPGVTNFNPLFIYGGVGLGKTHLMHSIGNHILRKNPEAKILYTTTESFTNEYIDSLKFHTTNQFRNKYRVLDILLLDDIQFISRKDATQEELFHTFNALTNINRQIVISSDQPPKDLKDIEERLTSRFGNGLIVDITFPDFETRTAILEKKAEQEGNIVPKDVIHYIANSIDSNIRELEGALIKIIAIASFGDIPITMSIAEREIRDFISSSEKHEITIDFITNVCSEFFNVSVEELKGNRRTKNVVLPRQIAMYLCRKLADVQSLLIIGKFFGGRDHSTVVYSCDKIASEIDSDITLKNNLIELERIIKGN